MQAQRRDRAAVGEPDEPTAGAASHGGNRIAIAARLGCRPGQLLDASASLVPFGPPLGLRLRLLREVSAGPALRDYPDRSGLALRQAIAAWHGLDPGQVLPGNGAAELFTWAARDAAACGLSLVPQPGFADYPRALACWGGAWQPLPLPLTWGADWPQRFPWPEGTAADATAPPAQVLWVTNPHNPTGQLWSRRSLEPLLRRFALVIVDEAFLPLAPAGEAESLLPLLAEHPNLVIIRSLTKLFSVAGLRLGYAVGDPHRLRRWAGWRDPWPVNGLATSAGLALLADHHRLRRWQQRVTDWVRRENAWLAPHLRQLPGLRPQPTATNFLLLRGERQGQPRTLEPLRQALETQHRILVRDCRSFAGLDDTWLRLGLQDRRGHRRLLRALRRESIP